MADLPYELAKAMRAAGYPKSHHWHAYNEGTPHALFMREQLPDLGDLILACGEEFGALVDNKGDGERWEACNTHVNTSSFHSVTGRTMEEAVAKLWLWLQGKKPAV